MSKRRKKRERGRTPEFSGYKPRKLIARSLNQKAYIKAIQDSDIVLCHGPAGTGKTHIAAGVAIRMMRTSQIKRIIICRPVVGVGKGIGYLPGSMEDKVGPYLIPLFDEFSHYCESSLLKTWAANGQLEIVPLSMMRGRTFNNAFIILDEAQNASMIELRMLLTRIGVHSKMVVSGDLQQSDLPSAQAGAFKAVVNALSDLEGVTTAELTFQDIVRHHLIGPIEARLAHLSIPENS